MFKKLKLKNEFSKNVLTLISGSAIAQILPIAISPIITRFYTPEDFGVFALYLAIVAILSSLATGRYEAAIMLPKNDASAINITALCIIITILVSLISLMIIIFFNLKIANLLHSTKISNWLYLIPIAILLSGIYKSFNYWLNRKKRYQKLATSRVMQSATNSTLSILMGIKNFGIGGLIFAEIISQAIATVLLIRSTLKNNLILLKSIKKIKIIVVFRKYIRFLTFGTAAIFTGNIVSQSLFFLISIFMDAMILGFVSLLSRIVSIPSSFISSNIGDVFYQEISQMKEEDVYEKILDFTKKLTIYSFIIFFFVYLVLSNYFTIIFGDGWSGATVYVKYVVIMAMFSFIFYPLTSLFNYFEIQGYNFLWQLLWLISNILVFISYKHFNLTLGSVFALYTVKEVLLNIGGIVFFIFYAKKLKTQNK